MKFSILIASFNNAPYIDECMESILKQSYTDWEAIFVDDCSTDNSKEVLEKWRAKDNRVKVFYNSRNSGCGYTKRMCAEKATGDIAAFVDPDDAIAENAIEVMIAEHKKYPGASLIHSTHYICGPDLKPEEINDRCGDNKNLLMNRDKIISHFASFKLDKYRSTEGIKPSLKRAIDQDLYYKLEEAGDVKFIDQPLYYYRLHRGGISSVGKNIRKSLYWHLLVQEEAFARRKGKRLAVSYDVLKNRWKNYYYSLMDEAKLEKNRGKYLFAWRKFCGIEPFAEIKLKLSLLKQIFSAF